MMLRRRKLWRVRVRRSIECWVEVSAFTKGEAEKEAAVTPGVLSVFARSAIPADVGDDPEREPARVEDVDAG